MSAGGPTVGVLALQGDVAEHERALASVGANAVRVRRPADLDGLDALILPGGESTTIAALARDYGLIRPIRELIGSGRPIWGTCAGLILLAGRADGDDDRIGGLDVAVRRNAFGRQVQSFEVDLAIRGVSPAGPFRAVFIRAPEITATGPTVSVLARLDHGGVVAVRQRNVLGTAFHPELTADDRMHRLFVEML